MWRAHIRVHNDHWLYFWVVLWMHLDEEMVDHVELHFSFFEFSTPRKCLRFYFNDSKILWLYTSNQKQILPQLERGLWCHVFQEFGQSSSNLLHSCQAQCPEDASDGFSVENGRQIGQAEVEELWGANVTHKARSKCCRAGNSARRLSGLPRCLVHE